MKQETENCANANNGGKRRSGKRLLVLSAVLLALATLAGIGVSSAAEGGCGHGWHHGHGMQSMLDPAAQEKHLDAMLKHILPDGTAEQKTKLRAIAKSAMDDLRPLHAQHEALHQESVKLLSAATIDRPAIEQERQKILHLLDQATLRITQAVEDAAEVLTPEQRLKLAEHLQRHKG